MAAPYCTQCGARVGGKSFCSQCGKPVGKRPPPPPPPPPAAAPPPPRPPSPPPPPGSFKGRLVTSAKTVSAPLRPELGYAFAGGIGVLLVALGLAMQRHSDRGILYTGVGLWMWISIGIGTLLRRIPRTMKIYEHGVEVKIPRGFNKSGWLPWSAVTKYEWDGDVIRYAWSPKSLIALSGGQRPSAWPIDSFPGAARIPSQQVSAVAAIVRHNAPPPRF